LHRIVRRNWRGGDIKLSAALWWGGLLTLFAAWAVQC
jgi:hypothetical protein